MLDKPEKCNICKKEYTTTHTEVMPGTVVYVCQNCLEKAKNNFIWLCVTCGTAYIRSKKLVISRIKDPELKRAFLLCQDMVIIQGLDACIECEPEMIVQYMDTFQTTAEC